MQKKVSHSLPTQYLKGSVLQLLIISLFYIMINSCTETDIVKTVDEMTMTLTHQSECTNMFKSAEETSQECFAYSYANETLELRHINAAFNCCPGKISFTYTLSDTLLTITEQEQEAGCNCLCLFDLDYNIKGLPQGRYVIRFTPTYLPFTEEVLEYEIDLTKQDSATCCVDRNSYPWII